MSPRRRHRPLVEIVEVEMPVKLRGCSSTASTTTARAPNSARRRYATTEGIDEKVAAETLAPFVAVDCEASQEHDGHRVGHSSPKSRRCPGMGDGAHGQRVIAHDHVVAAQHVGGRRTC